MPSSTGSVPRAELKLGRSRGAALTLLALQLPAVLGLWLIEPFWLALLLALLSAGLSWRQWRAQCRVERLAFQEGGWWLRQEGRWRTLVVDHAHLRPAWACLLGRCDGHRRLRLLWFADAVDAEAYRRFRVAVAAAESSAARSPAFPDNPG